jgi:hypothetical protein
MVRKGTARLIDLARHGDPEGEADKHDGSGDKTRAKGAFRSSCRREIAKVTTRRMRVAISTGKSSGGATRA